MIDSCVGRSHHDISRVVGFSPCAHICAGGLACALGVLLSQRSTAHDKAIPTDSIFSGWPCRLQRFPPQIHATLTRSLDTSAHQFDCDLLPRVHRDPKVDVAKRAAACKACVRTVSVRRRAGPGGCRVSAPARALRGWARRMPPPRAGSTGGRGCAAPGQQGSACDAHRCAARGGSGPRS